MKSSEGFSASAEPPWGLRSPAGRAPGGNYFGVKVYSASSSLHFCPATLDLAPNQRPCRPLFAVALKPVRRQVAERPRKRGRAALPQLFESLLSRTRRILSKVVLLFSSPTECCVRMPGESRTPRLKQRVRLAIVGQHVMSIKWLRVLLINHRQRSPAGSICRSVLGHFSYWREVCDFCCTLEI